MKNNWFSGDKTNNKQKKQKGMLGDELNKAELIGSRLRLSEHEVEEENEEIKAPKEGKASKSVKESKESKVEPNTTAQDDWMTQAKQFTEPKKENKLNIQHSSPFPIKNTSLRTQLRPDQEAENQTKKVEEEKKSSIQFSSPFPIKNTSLKNNLKLEEEKKPSIQHSSPFPPRRNIITNETKKEVQVDYTPKVEKTEGKKLDIQHASPFPPKKTIQVENQQEKKQDYLDVKPAWMQNISYQPQPIDRSNKEKPDVQIIIEDEVKPSQRELAREVIKKAPKESYVEVSQDIIKEEQKIEEVKQVEVKKTVAEDFKKKEAKQYNNVYKTLDNNSLFDYSFNQVPIADAYGHMGTEEIADHEEDVEEEVQDYGTSLEFEFNTTFNNSLQGEGEKFVEFETSFAPEATYGFDESYGIDDSYEDTYDDHSSSYEYYEDPLGFSTSFDLSSINATDEELEEEEINMEIEHILSEEYVAEEEVASTKEEEPSIFGGENFFYAPLVEEASKVEAVQEESNIFSGENFFYTPPAGMVLEEEAVQEKINNFSGEDLFYAPPVEMVSEVEVVQEEPNNFSGDDLFYTPPVEEVSVVEATQEKEEDTLVNLRTQTEEILSAFEEDSTPIVGNGLRTSMIINFNQENLHKLNNQVGSVIMMLNTAGEKYDFSITKNDDGGQNLSVVSQTEIVSKITALFNNEQGNTETLRISVIINFDEDNIHRLNAQVGNVIMLLNTSGEKYDFSIAKNEKGGQNLSVVTNTQIISKMMALFE